MTSDEGRGTGPKPKTQNPELRAERENPKLPPKAGDLVTEATEVEQERTEQFRLRDFA